MTLASTLYAEFRAAQDDPTALPAYGNLDAEQRRVWDRVAAKAEERGTSIEHGMVGIRCACGQDHILHGATSTRTEIEDAAAERVAAFVAREATRWEHAPQIDSAIAGVAGLIAEGEWRNEATLVIAPESARPAPAGPWPTQPNARCDECGKLTRGGHDRDGSDKCWGHDPTDRCARCNHHRDAHDGGIGCDNCLCVDFVEGRL